MESQLRDIPSARYTADTIREMWRHVDQGVTDPETIATARRIAKQVPARDRRRIAERLLKHTKQAVHFVNDPIGVETVAGVPWIRSVGAGDCDELCTYLAAHAEAVGIPSRFVTIKSSQPTNFDHVYCQLRVDGKWMGADPAVEASYLGWEPPRHYAKKVWSKRQAAEELMSGLNGKANGNGKRQAASMTDDDVATFAQDVTGPIKGGMPDAFGEPEKLRKGAKRGGKKVKDPFMNRIDPDIDVSASPDHGIDVSEMPDKVPSPPWSAEQHGKEVAAVNIARDQGRAALKDEFKSRFKANRALWQSAKKARTRKLREMEGGQYRRTGYLVDRDVAEMFGVDSSYDEIANATVGHHETAVKVDISPTDGSQVAPNSEAWVERREYNSIRASVEELLGEAIAAQVAHEISTGAIKRSQARRRARELAEQASRKVARPAEAVVTSKSDVDAIMAEAVEEVGSEQGWGPYLSESTPYGSGAVGTHPNAFAEPDDLVTSDVVWDEEGMDVTVPAAPAQEQAAGAPGQLLKKVLPFLPLLLLL